MKFLCGRFTLLQNELAIKERFRIQTPVNKLSPRYNIAPTEDVFAVIFDGEKNRAGHIRWGLVPSWAKDKRIGSKMINARIESAHEKPSFKHLMTQKRCLIVADSFYEWQQTEQGKVVHRIQVKNEALFAFAGLWDKWENNGERLFTCTMLTRDANNFMRPIHHRMPIILPIELEEEWIRTPFKSSKEARQFLLSLSTPEFESYEVSSYVNNVRNDDAACIEPLTYHE